MLYRLLTALLLAVVAAAGGTSTAPTVREAAVVHAATSAPHETLAPPPSFAITGSAASFGLDLRQPARLKAPTPAFSRPDRHPRAHRPAPGMVLRHLPFALDLARARAGEPAAFCHPPPRSLA